MRHFEAHEGMLEQLVNCFLEAYLNKWNCCQLISKLPTTSDQMLAKEQIYLTHIVEARQLLPKAFKGI